VSFLGELGSTLLFLKSLLDPQKLFSIRSEDLLSQLLKILASSWGTIALTGFFVGGIMVVQFSLQLMQFDALIYLGALATSGTVREVGPLLIGFILTAKVGAFTAAELGTLKVTDQIDALRCLGADPLREMIIPRFVAVVCASLFLLILGLVASLFGGIVSAYLLVGLSPQEYVRHIPQFLHWYSGFSGLLKCILFSMALAVISLYRGAYAEGGARGVGVAVVKSAVESLLALVFLDWLSSTFLNQLLEAFR
jgi:phospholipid/cholesterol/gamma-HCH transport system permease protein